MENQDNDNVKVIGPKGRISYVSRKAAESGFLRQIDFRPADDLIHTAKPAKGQKAKDNGR